MHRSLEELVWRRSDSRCEYCHISVEVEDLPTEIDHIIAEVHGGLTKASNLALSCLHCNKHKGTNLSGIDPRTRRHSISQHVRAFVSSDFPASRS